MIFTPASYRAAVIERKTVLHAISQGKWSYMNFRDEFGRDIPATDQPYEGSFNADDGSIVNIHLIGRGGRYDFVHSTHGESLSTLILGHKLKRAWSTQNEYTHNNWDSVDVTCMTVEQEFYEVEAELLANYACTQCHTKSGQVGAWDLNGEFHGDHAIHSLKSDVGFELFGEFPDIVTVYINANALCQHCASVKAENDRREAELEADRQKLKRWNQRVV